MSESLLDTLERENRLVLSAERSALSSTSDSTSDSKTPPSPVVYLALSLEQRKAAIRALAENPDLTAVADALNLPALALHDLLLDEQAVNEIEQLARNTARVEFMVSTVPRLRELIRNDNPTIALQAAKLMADLLALIPEKPRGRRPANEKDVAQTLEQIVGAAAKRVGPKKGTAP